MRLHRPRPILNPRCAWIDERTPPDQAAARLLAGEPLMVRDRYRTGARVLDAVEARLPRPSEAFAAREAHSRALREVGELLWAPIVNHRADIEGAQGGGFLAELYPELERFALPFQTLRELHGAWRRYQEGVRYAVLGHALHPFYGTYAPRRTEHLELFATWLSAWEGPKDRGIDVGAGCGVLSLLMARAGVRAVLATDINPNALESLHRDMGRLERRPNVTLRQSDLLDEVDASADLIVFNPPWLPGDARGPIEGALRAGHPLLERFFAQAAERLNPGGRVVVLYSNAAQLLRPDLPHPIEEELKRGRLVKRSLSRRRVRPSQKGRRTRERVELWELGAPE